MRPLLRKKTHMAIGHQAADHVDALDLYLPRFGKPFVFLPTALVVVFVLGRGVGETGVGLVPLTLG